MRGRGGTITAAVDVPGGPILAGDHRRRDRPLRALVNMDEKSEERELGEGSGPGSAGTFGGKR